MQPSNIIKQREAECRDGISLRPVPRCLLTTEECSHLIASLHSSSPIHVAADKTQPPPHTTFPHNLPAKPRACAHPPRAPPCACAPPRHSGLFGFPSALTAPAPRGSTCAVTAGLSPLPPKLREASGRLRPAASAAPPPQHPPASGCRIPFRRAAAALLCSAERRHVLAVLQPGLRPALRPRDQHRG